MLQVWSMHGVDVGTAGMLQQCTTQPLAETGISIGRAWAEVAIQVSQWWCSALPWWLHERLWSCWALM